jgi:tRNA acetyltransferase TAN1
LNLIVTCGRNLESEAKNEIKKIINELGDQELEILNSGMRGVLTVNTSVKPSEVIDHARNKINEEPWFMRYCLRIIPIQIVTDTDINKISQNVIKFKDCIQKNDSFRITVEKRGSTISTKEIIADIAKSFSNKVSLEKPTWIILIEVLGNKTGISILKNDGLFSLEKSKRSLE